MAKVIEFFIPSCFQKKAVWVPIQERGKIIEFRLPVKKSAWREAIPTQWRM